MHIKSEFFLSEAQAIAIMDENMEIILSKVGAESSENIVPSGASTSSFGEPNPPYGEGECVKPPGCACCVDYVFV